MQLRRSVLFPRGVHAYLDCRLGPLSPGALVDDRTSFHPEKIIFHFAAARARLGKRSTAISLKLFEPAPRENRHLLLQSSCRGRPWPSIASSCGSRTASCPRDAALCDRLPVLASVSGRPLYTRHTDRMDAWQETLCLPSATPVHTRARTNFRAADRAGAA